MQLLEPFLIDRSPRQREQIAATLRRRVAYLERRARAVADRPAIGGTPSWRDVLVETTLWIEAAEAATALDSFDQARDDLQRATRRLLELELPFGVALQRALRPGDRELAEQADRVFSHWGEALETGDRPADQEAGRPAEPSGLAVAARDAPQQWLHVAFAAAGRDAERSPGRLAAAGGPLRRRLAAFSAVPAGRLRWPLERFVDVAVAATEVVQAGREGAQRSWAVVVEAISDLLLGLFRSMRWAKRNTYLWDRLLMPAPLFDLDTAIVIARVSEVRPEVVADLKRDIRDRVAELERLDPEPALMYASRFIAAVEALREPPRRAVAG